MIHIVIFIYCYGFYFDLIGYIEFQFFIQFSSAKPKEGHQVGSGDGFYRRSLALERNANGRVQFSVVVTQVKKTPGACHHRAAQEQTGELHGY